MPQRHEKEDSTPDPGFSTTKSVALTAAAMFAFAGNSVFCRLALHDGLIDPSSFSAIRLIAGALMLLAISRIVRPQMSYRSHGGWSAAFFLFVYAITFSFAYVSLSVGAGALILFGFVQATMIAAGLIGGDRPDKWEWFGWSMAAAGLVWLLLPGEEVPSAGSAALMAIAGIAWALYSIRGRGETDPLAATTVNFFYCLLPVAILLALTLRDAELSYHGVMLATASGALTSALGYVVWYAALSTLTAIQGAMVQLSVPAIATIGGLVILSEPVSIHLLLSTMLILGGIAVALSLKSR